mmetsp:Transcript_54013/g.144707  ORF Transcript_54013/g.144707 Transcript_54013/m.144707 type:complete len:210 (-) Transcript_54013:19-648(-)
MTLSMESDASRWPSESRPLLRSLRKTDWKVSKCSLLSVTMYSTEACGSARSVGAARNIPSCPPASADSLALLSLSRSRECSRSSMEPVSAAAPGSGSSIGRRVPSMTYRPLKGAASDCARGCAAEDAAGLPADEDSAALPPARTPWPPLLPTLLAAALSGCGAKVGQGAAVGLRAVGRNAARAGAAAARSVRGNIAGQQGGLARGRDHS